MQRIKRVLLKGWVTAWVIACAVTLSACVGPPVQEMSNARQAIAAAQEAGAGKVAAENLERADTLLRSAEQRLQEKRYREARRAAIAAKQEAVEALARTKNADDNK
ncbi:MAG: DUF4398 domain-containing protein [Gammaproteobacteria bacterium]|nr:DUF4398 domain-containing protein [Gammaproteobacteria bacterium]NNM20370.1 DUF4398 domain-containing protein [Gammaproteobacteria bacterium]